MNAALRAPPQPATRAAYFTARITSRARYLRHAGIYAHNESTYDDTSRRCAEATTRTAPTTRPGATTLARRGAGGAITSLRSRTRSRSGARSASARTASRRTMPAEKRAATATAPTMTIGATTLAIRARRDATTSRAKTTRSTSAARSACRTMAYWRSTPAAKRAAAAKRRGDAGAARKNSLPGARTPLPRSLPIV